MPVQTLLPAVLTNFENTSPGDSFITMLFLADTLPDTTSTVHAVNINTTACFNVSVFDSIAALTQLSFTVNGEVVTTQVSYKVNKGNYWHFKVVPFQVSSTEYDNSCNLTLFEPSIVSTAFTNSDFNAILSNATFSRTSDFIFDVDRIRNQSEPTNLAAILDNSADQAPVQDSSYSSIGITNSRYNGSKTNINEYGFSAAINASMFEGAVYAQDKHLPLVCSQSAEDRPTKDYLFSIDSKYDPQLTNEFMYVVSPTKRPDSLDIPQTRFKLAYSGSITDAYTSGTANQINPLPSEHLFLPGNRIEEIFANRFYVIRMGEADYEIIKLANPVFDAPTNKTRYDVQHTAFADITGNVNVLTQVISSNTGELRLYEMLGDTIYNIEGSQVFKITEKLIYVGESNFIYYIDDKGQVIAELTDCSI